MTLPSGAFTSRGQVTSGACAQPLQAASSATAQRKSLIVEGQDSRAKAASL
jgi:hypothetical protein